MNSLQHKQCLYMKDIYYKARLYTQAKDYLKDNILQDPKWKNAKPFSEIPGPSKFKFIRAIMPRGKYHGLEMNDLLKKMNKEYGTLLKLPGFFGQSDSVLAFNPNLIEKVMRTEGRTPWRSGSEPLKYYRKNIRPNIFKGLSGLVPDQGEKWRHFRTSVNPIMLKPQYVNKYIPMVDAVGQDFITKIKIIRDDKNEMPDNFLEELNKWALESISVIALGDRLGVIFNENHNTETDQLIKAVKESFQLSLEFDSMSPLWKYYQTRKFKKLMSSLDVVTEIWRKYITANMKRYDNVPNNNISDKSILHELLNINRDYAIIMMFDILLAGVDTTSTVLSGLFYNLAINPEKQEKLRNEINKILPDKSSKFNIDSLSYVPYLRACMKESMRLLPVFYGNIRGAGKDIVLNGYQIPKNTDVYMVAVAMQHDEKYFPNCNQFIPERWLKNNQAICPSFGTKNPYVFLPFGFGIRSCIGKRFAEIEIQILTARFLKEFKIEWNYDPLKFGGILNSPLGPLKFKFISL